MTDANKNIKPALSIICLLVFGTLIMIWSNNASSRINVQNSQVNGQVGSGVMVDNCNQRSNGVCLDDLTDQEIQELSVK
jgi:hypothetical protein